MAQEWEGTVRFYHLCCCQPPQNPLLSTAPFHRMMGADRSLVTVGRSFTVANGLVPRGKSSGGCSCTADFLESEGAAVLAKLLRRLPAPSEAGEGLGEGSEAALCR